MSILPAAVLWDMDGTLVDTEPYWSAAERDLVHAAGGVWSDEDANALIGNDLMVSARLIKEHSPVELSELQIIDALLGRVVEQVQAHVPWRPGARELLVALNEADVPCALVTMSWRSLADAVLGALPDGLFTTVVTGDEVSHGKPHPEPYAAAARVLGVDTSRCVAIEDSPTGVRSAVAAGVPTLAVPHLVPIPAMPGATAVDTLVGVTPQDLGALLARP